MNFAQQTTLIKATEYFNNEMTKVYVREICQIRSFAEHIKKRFDINQYCLSSWALMGLKPDDCLIRGQIDLPEHPNRKVHPNYKHGWVQFYYENGGFIYDSRESFIWEQNHWEETFKPHDLTFMMTQQEILKLALEDEAYDDAYKINKELYQFKSSLNMQLQYNCEDDGFLRDTLGSSQICYSNGKVSYFLAEQQV